MTTDNAARVETNKPIAGWYGGKYYHGENIARLIESMPHACYVDVFCGMLSVFLYRKRKTRTEVINDLNGEIVNLFRVVRRWEKPLGDLLRTMPTSRAEFSKQRALPPLSITDIERAARFLYLTTCAYNKLVSGRFRLTKGNIAAFNTDTLPSRIETLSKRISATIIENLRWQDCITRYDSTGTMFYCDPPYWGHEDEYGKGLFARKEFKELASLLKGVKGKFVMSINDRPEIREIFSDFNLRTFDNTYRSSGITKPVQELLLYNFDPPSSVLF